MSEPNSVQKLTVLIPGIVSARHPETMIAPARATKGAAAWDMHCVLANTATHFAGAPNPYIKPGCSLRFDTGVSLVWDPGYTQRVYSASDPERADFGPRSIMDYGVVSLRSSLRANGLSILGDGIIDMDYSGTIVCRIWNVSDMIVSVELTKAVAQLRICSQVSVLPSVTGERVAGNAGGFGSTSRATECDGQAEEDWNLGRG